jgi:hypothetical protein
MADKIKLLELDIDTESIIAKSVQLKKDLDEVRASVNEMKKAGDTSSESFITQSVQMNKLSQEYNLNQKQLVALTSASGSLLTATEKANAVLGIEANTVNEAKNQNKELLKIRDEINVKTPEGVIAVQKINEKIDENSKFIKENVSDLEKQRLNIGNYTDAINNSAIGTSLWGNKLNDLKSINDGLKDTFAQGKEVLKGYADGIKDFTKGTDGMTTAQKASTIATNLGSGAMNIFKVALASTGIGLLVLALASLIAYFTQTQSGINKLQSVLQPLKAIFSAVTGVVLSLGEGLVNAFSNPKKAMTDLYEFVKTNLINRFKAFGEIIEGIINLDFKKVTNGVLQAGTGVENLTDKISTASSKTASFLNEAAKKGKEIADLSKQISEEQLKYNANQVAIGDEIDRQLLISKDTSKSFSERAKAANEIIRITEENGKQEQKILQLKLQQLQAEQSLKGAKNLTNEDKQKTIDLLTQIDEAEDRGLNARLEQSRVISGARKEAQDKALADAQKAHDQAMAQSKAELDLFIQQQGFRAKSLQENLDFENKVKDKKLAVLKAEFDAKKINQTEYEAQSLSIKNEFLKKQAEATIAFAEIELNDFLDKTKTKIEKNKFLNDELFFQEQERLSAILKAEQDFAEKKKEQGLINDEELRQAKKEAQDKFEEDQLQLKFQKEEADKEKQAIDAENKKIADDNEFQNQYAIKQQQLENLKIQEIENAKKTGADINIINAKYANLEKQLQQEVTNYKKSLQYENLGLIKSIFGEQTVLGKAAAISQIYMDTSEKANKTFALAKSYYANPLTIPLGINADIQTGLIIASGAVQAGKVAGIKLSTGAIDIQGPGSETSDSIPAMLSRGESVINAKSTAAFKPLLQSINDGKGLNYLQANTGSIYNTQTNNGVTIDYNLLASKISEANKSLPAPKVYTAIEDFKIAERNYNQINDAANH